MFTSTLFIKIFFVYTCSLLLIQCSAQGDGYCQTPKDQRGFCINILYCPQLLNLLKTHKDPQVLAYLQSSTCGYEGKYPLVCCPENVDYGSGTGPGKSIIDVTTAPPPPTPPPVITDPPTQPPSPVTPAIQYYNLPKSPTCGYSNVSNTKVVNGVDAKLGEFPWIVALGYRNNENPTQPKWLCGSTLITDRHVLTAGHCVNNRPDLYIARLGELDLYNDNDGAQPIDIPIANAKIHEAYSPTSFTNDIALLTLSQSVTGAPNVRPICIPVGETRTFEKYYPFVAGWGATYFNGPASSKLQVAMLPVVTNAQCKQAFVNFKTTVIDNRVLCAGYTQGGKDACQGDSGGPLMWAKIEGNDIIFYLIGVVSYGYKCAEVGYPGVYTRVTQFTDWIQQNLN